MGTLPSAKHDRVIGPSVTHQEQQGLNEVLPWASSDSSATTLQPPQAAAFLPSAAVDTGRIIHR